MQKYWTDTEKKAEETTEGRSTAKETENLMGRARRKSPEEMSVKTATKWEGDPMERMSEELPEGASGKVTDAASSSADAGCRDNHRIASAHGQRHADAVPAA